MTRKTVSNFDVSGPILTEDGGTSQEMRGTEEKEVKFGQKGMNRMSSIMNASAIEKQISLPRDFKRTIQDVSPIELLQPESALPILEEASKEDEAAEFAGALSGVEVQPNLAQDMAASISIE